MADVEEIALARARLRRSAPPFRMDLFDWPSNWQVLLVGQRGSGKTYAAKRLLDRKYGQWQIVVYQSKPRVKELDKLAVKRVATIPTLKSALAKGEPFIIFRPPPEAATDRAVTEAFCQTIFESEVKRGIPRPILTYIDEASAFTSFSAYPATWFGVLVTQGREMEKGLILAAQEPAFLPRMIYAESQLIFRFYLHGNTNMKALRDKLPAVVEETPLPEGPHAFVLWDARDRGRAYPFRKVI